MRIVHNLHVQYTLSIHISVCVSKCPLYSLSIGCVCVRALTANASPQASGSTAHHLWAHHDGAGSTSHSSGLCWASHSRHSPPTGSTL